jgi:hypothetical protein
MTKLNIFRPVLSVVSSVLLTALIVAPAAAQDVDAKGNKELTRLAKGIDKSAADRDAGRVTSRIVDEWKGTTFKFDAGGAPRALTAQDVRNLRAKGLGYGEISILLALTAKQPNAATAKSLDQILAMRQAHEGWGKIAKDLGYKSLGAVVSSVKASEKALARVAMERSEKPGTREKMEKPEKMEKMERPEKPGR